MVVRCSSIQSGSTLNGVRDHGLLSDVFSTEAESQPAKSGNLQESLESSMNPQLQKVSFRL